MSSIVTGKNVLITGGNTGIGRATAEALARQGARLHLACRSEQRTAPVIASLRQLGAEAHFLPLDLTDLRSVKACAERFLSTGAPLQVLINNAGLARVKGLTPQGFEITFGVNHLGHFLLTSLLQPALAKAGQARVVVVASRAHSRLRRTHIDFDEFRRPTASFTGFPEYCVSKLCNVLFARELARRWDPAAAHSYAVHPGVIASDIWRRVPQPLRALGTMWMDTVEQGARASIRCASDPALADHNGRYYTEDGSEISPSRLAQDDVLAKRLWDQSEEWVRPFTTA